MVYLYCFLSKIETQLITFTKCEILNKILIIPLICKSLLSKHSYFALYQIKFNEQFTQEILLLFDLTLTNWGTFSRFVSPINLIIIYLHKKKLHSLSNKVQNCILLSLVILVTLGISFVSVHYFFTPTV